MSDRQALADRLVCCIFLKTAPVWRFISFLENAPESDYDGALMEAIVHLGHKLNLKIVVEGIETQTQLTYCERLGVEYAQGYFFAKPLTASIIQERLECQY